MILQNLHTHTVFCDGQNTCREIADEAIKLGFDSIGFSGHAYMTFDTSYCMSIDDTKKYISEIQKLKEEYSGKLKIYTGIEFDLFSICDRRDFDYIIGSVHYIKKDGKYLPVDLDANFAKFAINEYFGGDAIEYARAYFAEVRFLAEKCNFDILGHFDLVSKFSKFIPQLSADNKAFREIAIDTIKYISKFCKIFEVNTGAIARGYTNMPYPHITLLKEFKACGMMPVISSDCHLKTQLDFWFDNAAELVKSVGYKEIMIYDDGSFRASSL